MDIQNLFISMNGTIKVKEISKETFKVFHNNTKALGIINQDGKKLLELCNGRKRIKEIVDEIALSYINDKNEVEEMVVAGLKHFKWVNMVRTSDDEITEEYNYKTFNSAITIDHIIFDLSKTIRINCNLDNSIRELSEKGLFQITVICNSNIEVDMILNIIALCNKCEIVTNVFVNTNELNEDEVMKIAKMVNGRIIFGLINYNDENNINSAIHKQEVINNIRVIREASVPVDIQIRTNNVNEFQEAIKLGSFLDVEKLYYTFNNDSLRDEFERNLDNTETQLLGKCSKLPEVIQGEWYECRDNEIISFYEDLNMEVGACEN